MRAATHSQACEQINASRGKSQDPGSAGRLEMGKIVELMEEGRVRALEVDLGGYFRPVPLSHFSTTGMQATGPGSG